MANKELMQSVFEQMALVDRSNHNMLCDFRKDSDGNYMSACEKAAFWAWSTVQQCHNPSDAPIPFFDMGQGKDYTSVTKVLKLGDKIKVIDFDSFSPSTPSLRDDFLENRRRYIADNLPNRNGQIYNDVESPNLNLSDLSDEIRENIIKAVQKLGEMRPPSISIRTHTAAMVDVPKNPPFYYIDQLAFLPNIKNMSESSLEVTSLETNKKLDEALEKVREGRGLTTFSSLDQGAEFIPAFKTTPTSQDQSLEDAEETVEEPVFKPIHSLY